MRLVPNAEAFVACVQAAGAAQDRMRSRAFVAPVTHGPARPGPPQSAMRRHGFTGHESHVYGILRAKQGMSQEAAVAAVLRSRASAPARASEP